MGKLIDLTGMIFGRLKVIEYNKEEGKWLCECSCENHTRKLISGNHLRSGATVSCGCYNREIVASRYKGIDPKDNPNKKYNTFRFEGDVCIGTDSKGKEFIFDAEFYDDFKDTCWFIDTKGYVLGKINGKMEYMHRMVTDCQWKMVDHKNKNRADNRLENLRECNIQTNGFNRKLNSNNKTGVSGVSEDKERPGTYKAGIKYNQKSISIGTYHNFDDAVRARLLKEKELFGEFAPQKHLFKEYAIDTDDQI